MILIPISYLIAYKYFLITLILVDQAKSYDEAENNYLWRDLSIFNPSYLSCKVAL